MNQTCLLVLVWSRNVTMTTLSLLVVSTVYVSALPLRMHGIDYDEAIEPGHPWKGIGLGARLAILVSYEGEENHINPRT